MALDLIHQTVFRNSTTLRLCCFFSALFVCYKVRVSFTLSETTNYLSLTVAVTIFVGIGMLNDLYRTAFVTVDNHIFILILLKIHEIVFFCTGILV